MAISITSTTPSAAPNGFPAASTGGLEAQLAEYRKKLSECVTCSSANTPEGRREIQQLQTQISNINARIESIQRQKNDSGQDANSTQATRPSHGGSVDVYA